MDSTREQKPFGQRLQERIAESRFITFSLLLHTILVLLGGSVVLIHRISTPDDFAPPDGRIVAEELTAQPPSERDQMAPVQQDLAPKVTASVAPPLPVITTTTMNTTGSAVILPPQVVVVPGKDGRGEFKKIPTKPGPRLPGPMERRVGGTGQLNWAMKTGGTKKSEEAVMAGLRWLKTHQNTDGSWSDEFKPAMTGLALLAFLGHGELPISPDFGPTVNAGLNWVLTRGTEFQGRMSLTKDGWGGNHGVYEHAILTYAMAEYYSMTKDPRFEPLLGQAVEFIVAGQNPRGGWDYQYKKGVRNDLSVAGWQIQALKAAHLTGLGLRGVDEALDKSMGFIAQWQGGEGGFGYDKRGDKPSLTGVGVLCTYFWKGKKERVVQDGMQFLLGKADVRYDSGKADLYSWYYDGQACLMFGEPAWGKWNRMFQSEIVGHQSPDGSWPPTPGGAGDLQRKADGAGPFYRTTLCVLMLEVFYRNMPSNK